MYRLRRAWRAISGPSRPEIESEGDDLIDDWKWWHARGSKYPRGALHAELRRLIAHSPIFSELALF